MAKKLAMVFGIVFVLVGLLGVIGGVGIVGPDGIFHTDSVHDWIHIISGVLFLVVAFAAPTKASLLMMVFGIVYLLIGVLGFFMNPVLGFLHVNTADNILHLVLGAVILWGGLKTKGGSAMMSSGMGM